MTTPQKLKKPRKRLKLTPEQRKLIWKPSSANAGAGWDAKNADLFNHDPRYQENGGKE